MPSKKSRAAGEQPSRLAQLPWVPIAITLAVLITAGFAVDAVRDAVSLGTVGEAHLEVSSSYLAIAPISAVLDTVTLLTVGQHIALLLWVIGLFAIVRVRRAHAHGTAPRREAIAAFILLASIFLLYAAATMMPRPMAALTTSDDAIIVLDFHSHTQYSHDGRAGWTEDDVRNWYQGAGFNAAYITDHATFEGAERGVASNPGQAGQGTMLLQGIEAFYKGEHVNILGAGRRYKGLLDATQKDVDEDALRLASILPAMSPLLIETMPGKLDKIHTIADSPTAAGVSAIEIVDGSPRGLSQTRRDRQHIAAIADSFNLALVSGSDNHGFGRAAPGWTLMRLDGWRGMRGDSLSARVEEILRRGRRGATRVVERRVAGGENPIALVLAAPLIAWRMLTTLSGDERVMWIIWTWVIVIIVRGFRRFRVRPSTAA